MSEDSLDHPFCFECGYDLTGLKLPRPCPECGTLSDPAAQAAEAREWFARRSARMGWLVRPRTVPLGIWYVLHDPASVKLARRRVARWLWLPAILTFITVSVGCFITVEYDTRIWYWDLYVADLQPVHDFSVTEFDHLFFRNDHVGNTILVNMSATWVPVVERQRESLGIGVPNGIDSMFLLWGCVPLLAIAFGYFPSSRLVVTWTRFRACRQRRVYPAMASQTAWSLIAVPLGLGAWVWLLAAVVYGLSELLGFSALVMSALVLAYAAVGWWILVSVVGYCALVRLDRPGFVVRSRLGLWAIAVILNLGGPVVVGWGMLWLIV